MKEKNTIAPGRNLRHKRRFNPWSILIYLVLTLWALTTIYPFFWVIQNSFRIKKTDPLRLVFDADRNQLYIGQL